jgi:hypothetical protein
MGCNLRCGSVPPLQADPETYPGAAALLGREPTEVMPVESYPSDLDAAAKYGLRTCYVSRPLEYGAGRVVEATSDEGRFRPHGREFDRASQGDGMLKLPSAAAPSPSAVLVSTTRRETRWQSILPLFMIDSHRA